MVWGMPLISFLHNGFTLRCPILHRQLLEGIPISKNKVIQIIVPVRFLTLPTQTHYPIWIKYKNFGKKGIPKKNHLIARLKLALIDGHKVGFKVGFFVGQVKFFSDIFSVKRYCSTCNM